MVLHISLIMLQGAGPKGSGHLPQPLLQPFREGHPAPLRQVDALVNVDVLAELRGQFLLGAGVEVAKDGIAVFFVSHYDAALPAAVLPFTHHTVAGWPALCHLLFTSRFNVAVVGIHAFHHDFGAQPETQNEVFHGGDAVDFLL